MFIFDIKGLTNYLKANVPTERDKLNYMIMWICLGVFHIDFIKQQQPVKNLWVAIAISLIILAVKYAILKSFYNSNRGDKGRDFLFRYVSLSLVIAVRVGVFSVVVMSLSFLVSYFVFKTQNLFLGTGLLLFIGGFFYYLVNMHDILQKLAASDRAKEEALQASD